MQHLPMVKCLVFLQNVSISIHREILNMIVPQILSSLSTYHNISLHVYSACIKLTICELWSLGYLYFH